MVSFVRFFRAPLSIIKAFVGDKSEKDVKALQPYLLKSRL
jgi:hypothetical protein